MVAGYVYYEKEARNARCRTTSPREGEEGDVFPNERNKGLKAFQATKQCPHVAFHLCAHLI